MSERRKDYLIMPDNATIANLRREASVFRVRINLHVAETMGLRQCPAELLDEIARREAEETDADGE